MISIHAPLTGSDLDVVFFLCVVLEFQSTLPSQGATDIVGGGSGSDDIISIHAPLTGSDGVTAYRLFIMRNFNPRSPHRERPQRLFPNLALQCISIHAPLTGSDLKDENRRYIGDKFQSTLPSQGAT